MSQNDWELLVAPDFAGDVSHWSKPDGEGGLLIRSTQEVGDILDSNKAMRTHNDGYTADRSLRRVATIPLIVRNYILNEEGWDPWQPSLYPEKMAAFLNNPDWAHLRTADGRVAATNGVVR